MTEEIENNPAEETESKNPVLIKRSKRATVRLSLRAERKRLKKLEKEMSQGRDVIDDIDACKGEIELLFKELQSIEEGGHTTFLHAKELIAPKKNISSKKEFIRGEIRKTYTEIAELEENKSNFDKLKSYMLSYDKKDRWAKRIETNLLIT